MRGVAIGTVMALALALAIAPTTQAHGPCDCLAPARAAPGARVAIDYPVFKVVFNPDRADLGIGPESLWARHRPGAPITVLRREWRDGRPPARPGGFTVPDVAPGRYVVALYDGDEGGAHYSWETLTVTRAAARAARPAPAPANDDGGIPVPLAVGIGAAALLAGLVLGRRVRPR